jgi:hypothetical protein
MGVKVGEKILFGKYSGRNSDGRQHTCMREDIIGVVPVPLSAPITIPGEPAMADVRFGEHARNRMVNGVNILANAVKIARPQGRNVVLSAARR